MPHPTESEATAMAADDATETIEIARRRDNAYPVVTIADGADHHAQTTGFHKHWWRSRDEDWPAAIREAYDEAFTRDLHAAEVAVVELRFDAAKGNWTNIGVVDLGQWEPTFPFDRESTGWIQQDARSRVGWRRRSALRKLFGRKKDKGRSAPESGSGMPESPTPFTVEIADGVIDDLRERLARTRWPDAETVEDWSQGLPLGYARELCAYWEREYEMGRVAERLNARPQFTAEIDGLAVHFIHRRSPHPEAVPLVLTHGWPGSVLEFVDLVGPLSEPEAHGGEAADAFHVVIPSLPGYGFGGKPTETGWGIERIADAWAELMARLGYERFVAQGGDWGAPVSIGLALRHPERVAGLSLNYPLPPRPGTPEPTAEERADLDALKRFRAEGMGYSTQQATRPQTVAYGLTDSPAAQAAWIVEKFCAWSDCDGHPENSFSRDQLLDNVMVYWCNATAASSARLYWESFGTALAGVGEIATPTAYVAYPREIIRLSERLARTRFTDLRHYSRPARGGHFAALEVPDTFLAEVRAGVRALGVRD